MSQERAARITTTSNEKISAERTNQVMIIAGAIVVASLVGAGTVVLTKRRF